MVTLRLLNPKYVNRKALAFILSLRNNPQVRTGFYTQGFAEPHDITWTEHLTWWKSRPSSWREFLIEGDNQVVGVLTIGQMEYWEPETGIMIHPDYWGKGYAKQALELAFKYLRANGKKYTRTTIRDNNERSIGLYTSLGFERIDEARPYESLYRKTL